MQKMIQLTYTVLGKTDLTVVQQTVMDITHKMGLPQKVIAVYPGLCKVELKEKVW